MQTVLRVIVTLFFIAIIVLGVVFFSIFAFVPKEKLARVKEGNFGTSSAETAKNTKSIFDIPFFNQFKELLSSRDEPVMPTSTQEVAVKPQELVPPGPPDKPQQSSAIEEDQIPEGSIELHVSLGGFSPSSFPVEAGDMVSLALVSDDAFTHTLSFDNEELSRFSMGVAAQETRVIFFWAPKEKGTYHFRCGLPGHADHGETGTMVVK